MSTPSFRLFLWPQRLLLLGPAFDTAPHRHHAAQLAVGLQGALRVRNDVQQPWQSAPAFHVPPDMEHAFDSEGACALLYLDPESGECARARARFGETSIRLLPASDMPLATLRQLSHGGGTAAQAARACATMLGHEATEATQHSLDPRMLRVLAWLDSRLDQPVTLAQTAAAAAVSESWLSHRFSTEIGVPLRRYLLWRRLRLAVETALGGATLTEAAHAAGLSDSAHLTRSFRDMFGVAPSLLFQQRDALHVTLCGPEQR